MLEKDSTFFILCLVVGGILLLLFLGSIALRLGGFLKELRYINAEIERTEGKDRAHYIKRRKKLWLSLLPFYRKKT